MDKTSTPAPNKRTAKHVDPFRVDAQTAREKAIEAQLSSHVTAGLVSIAFALEASALAATLMIEPLRERGVAPTLSVMIGILIVLGVVLGTWNFLRERRAFAYWRFAHDTALARGEFEPTEPEPAQAAPVLEDKPKEWWPPHTDRT